MKILLISSYLPYPLFSGGHVRLYNLIKELSSKHEITLVCEKRSHQTQKDIAEIEKICKKVIAVERRKQWSFSNILQAGTSSHSFLVTGHTNSEFQQKIQEMLVKNKFDLIHVETYYVMQNLLESGIRNHESGGIPVVLVEHNIEYTVYQKFMNRAPMFARPLLKIDIAKIKKEEEYFWKKASALVAVSREDQSVISRVGLKSYLVSNGVNTEQFTFKSFEERSHFASNFAKATLDKQAPQDKKILFIGDFKWIQNQDTVKFIIKEIWPKIVSSMDLKLWIVGRKIPESIKGLSNDPRILFDEKSSSLPTEKIFQAASILLTPIRVGGGTSYKILESMSSGTPVVTMQLSADAIDAINGENIMIGKNAEELAEKSLELLQNDSVYKLISKNGRKLVEDNYTWKEIGKKLEEVYKSVV